MLLKKCGGTVPESLRVYVCGPHVARGELDRLANVVIAARVGLSLVLKGHEVHVPQATALFWEGIVPRTRAQRSGRTFLERWAQAVFVAERSAASERELAVALRRGLPVWSTINEVPSRTAVSVPRRLERYLESPQCLDWLYRKLNRGSANPAVSRHLLQSGTIARLERALFECVDVPRGAAGGGTAAILSPVAEPDRRPPPVA